MMALWKNAPAVTILLAINILLFLPYFINPPLFETILNNFGLYYFHSSQFKFYQIITHAFVHASLPHIAFNMFALLMFGGQLEYLWKTKRFLIFYLITGLGAAFLHQAVSAFEIYQISGSIMPDGNSTILSGLTSAQYSDLQFKYFVPIVGASGAIYGLLLGYAVLFPDAKLIFLLLPVPVKAKYLIPVLMVVELFLGVRQFSFDNIAHFAHIGGALFGFILVKLWSRK